MDREMKLMYSQPIQYLFIIAVYLLMVFLTVIATTEDEISYIQPRKSFPIMSRKRKSKPIQATYNLSDKQKVS